MSHYRIQSRHRAKVIAHNLRRHGWYVKYRTQHDDTVKFTTDAPPGIMSIWLTASEFATLT